MGTTAVDLIGKFDEFPATMTAANNNTVPIDGLRSIEYTVQNVNRTIPTRYIKSLKYQAILGFDFLTQYKMIIDFGTGTCCLPGGCRGE